MSECECIEKKKDQNGIRDLFLTPYPSNRFCTVDNKFRIYHSYYRTCYNANPRPDALMKEQLVEMTGLSPRVIRVWFQNKRCKDKKKTIQMKLQMQQEKDGRKLGYGAMQGIPMVASSPVRHDSPLNLHGIEVTSYQPPWKTLSDFALNADLDNNTMHTHNSPAFQQLYNQVKITSQFPVRWNFFQF